MPDPADPNSLLVPVITFLLLGMGAAALSRLARLSPIVGFLLLGTALAFRFPHLIARSATASLLAELGVSFLLFDIGLHFSLVHVRRQAADIFGFGPAQVVFGTLALGLAGWSCGLAPGGALLVGATLALSSTAVVGDIIAERHQRNCPVGLTGTAILVFQDVVAIILLVVAGALHGGDPVAALAVALVKACAAFALAVGLARFAVRPLFTLLARDGGGGVFTATALALALVTGWAAERAGLSMSFGAFLGGMVLADSPFRAAVGAEIAPFRILLLGFFFISVGGSLDSAVIVAHWTAIVALAVGMVVLKCVSNGLASLAFRWSLPGSVQLGFLLAQGSEFAFVIFGVASVRGLVGGTLTSELTAAVVLTMAATPPISSAGRWLAGRLRMRDVRLDYAELRPIGQARPVLILGMDEIGRTLADALGAFEIGYDGVERDGGLLRRGVADGYQVYFGDWSDARLWRALDLPHRRCTVVTALSFEVVNEMQAAAGAIFPGARLLLVTTDASSGETLFGPGVDMVIERERPPGLAAARLLLLELGIKEGAVDRWIFERRVGMDAIRISGTSDDRRRA